MTRNEVFKKYRTALIENSTDAEIIFKNRLDLFKVRYIFQYRIDYNNSFIIADFFIKSIKLVIEIDGGYHRTKIQREKDRLRDEFLKENGYKVIRILNEDVDAYDIREIIKLFKHKKSYSKPKKIDKSKSKLQVEADMLENKINKFKQIEKKKQIILNAYPHLFKNMKK